MRFYTAILICLFTALGAFSQPYCEVTTYDEDSGLSQRLVKGIVQDRAGYIWIGTWNGLNRFDGKEFATLRPAFDDEAYRYSDRISDLHLSPLGNLLCRIDDRISLFDVNTFKYTDLHALIEKELGKKFALRHTIVTEGKEIVLATKDNKYIVVPDELSVKGAYISDTLPDFKYISRGNRSLRNVGSFKFDDLVLSRRDSLGTVWLITRDGRIISAPSTDGPFTEHERLDVTPGTLFYSTTDNSGNVWLRSSEGAHRIALRHRPYSTIATQGNSMVRTTMRDSHDRVWLSESDSRAVAVIDPAHGQKLYIGSDGLWSTSFKPFGASIYAIAEGKEGEIWLGSKPDGAFRLTPSRNRGFIVDRWDLGYVYDFHFDPSGALWIATMGNGLIYCPNPSDDKPQFLHLRDRKGYPADAKLVRHLEMAGDTMMLCATTSGLLAVDISSAKKPGDLRASLITSRPGVAGSLGNIAVMDVTAASDGTILVATESDGINVATPAAIDRPDDWTFTHHNAETGLTDVALAVVEAPAPLNGWHVVTSNNRVYLFHPATGRKIVYGQWFWGQKLRFTDSRPLLTADGQWLIGHENGAVTLAMDTIISGSAIPPVMFTAASIQGQPERLLTASTDTLRLGPHERNLTIKFAALDFALSPDIEYSVKLGNDDWVNLGTEQSLTLLDLTPGDYKLSVRASSPAGNIIDRTDTITIIVTPTIWETTTAKVLYVVVALLVIGICVWTVIYIRAMKRKQHEILNAYLSLVNAGTDSPKGQNAEDEEARSTEMQKLPLSAEDKTLMDSVTTFVTEHIADPSVTVDDMASAVALSRSSLNRKMKSIMGVSPAEFIRESRLSQAARLLTETDRSLKEIAYDCGFADINYFGKCFKASRGVTPGAYRKSELK